MCNGTGSDSTILHVLLDRKLRVQHRQGEFMTVSVSTPLLPLEPSAQGRKAAELIRHRGPCPAAMWEKRGNPPQEWSLTTSVCLAVTLHIPHPQLRGGTEPPQHVDLGTRGQVTGGTPGGTTRAKNCCLNAPTLLLPACRWVSQPVIISCLIRVPWGGGV